MILIFSIVLMSSLIHSFPNHVPFIPTMHHKWHSRSSLWSHKRLYTTLFHFKGLNVWPFLPAFCFSANKQVSIHSLRDCLSRFSLSSRVCSVPRSVWPDMGSCPFVPERMWPSTCSLLPPGWPACWPSWRSNSLESGLHSQGSNSLWGCDSFPTCFFLCSHVSLSLHTLTVFLYLVVFLNFL